MRITTRGQLAVSAMTDLAMRQNTGPVALSTISARQGTSLSYLEQLFSALKRAGLVDSTRGPAAMPWPTSPSRCRLPTSWWR